MIIKLKCRRAIPNQFTRRKLYDGKVTNLQGLLIVEVADDKGKERKMRLKDSYGTWSLTGPAELKLLQKPKQINL